MTWEEKLSALKSLGDAVLRMRKPGDWYVDQRVEIGGDGILRGSYGNGGTPQQAVEEHWKIMTGIAYDKYIVLHAMDDTLRRHVRWNGYMWEDELVAKKVQP